MVRIVRQAAILLEACNKLFQQDPALGWHIGLDMLDELLSRLLNGLLISQVDEGSNVLPRSINGIFCVCSVAYDVGCCSAALDDEATSIFVFSAGQFCITTARDVLFFFQGFQILAVI